MAKVSYFITMYNLAQVPELKFNPDWKNGYREYDNLIKADLGLKPGDMVKFKDLVNRHHIVIGSRFGNIVFMQHGFEEDCEVIVTRQDHKVKEITMYVLSTSLSKVAVENYLDYHNYKFYSSNLGKRIEKIAEIFNKEKEEE